MSDNPEALIKLANKGDARAQYKLALAYELGMGFKQNWHQAFAWYQRAAEQNDAKAQYNLAIFYALGKVAEKDTQQAKYWIKKAHENGYSGSSIF